MSVGQETLPADGYLQPRRYKITAQCERCGGEFHWVTTKLDGKDRPCPKRTCKEAIHREAVEREAMNMAKMFAEQRPPGHIGDKPIVHAIDTTAEIVMKDYGMTDLRDNIRTGDSMAPSLPPEMQRAADGFFTGAAVRERAGGGNLGARAMQAIGRRAVAGAFRSAAVAPPQNVVGKDRRVVPSLRHVRTEQPIQAPKHF